MKKSLGHWVPQTYLNRFAIDPLVKHPKIFKYRKNGKIFPDNISKVASKKNFYIFTDKKTKEESADLENAFSQLEGEYKISSDKLLLNKNFNKFENRDRAVMSEFLAYSFVRTPAFIDRIRTLVLEVFKLHILADNEKEKTQLFEKLKKEFPAMTDDEAIKNINEFYSNTDQLKLKGGKWYFLKMALRQSTLLKKMAYEKKWHILIAEGNDFFITSDNPLVIQASRDFPVLQNAGFMNGTIILTLSPKIALLLRNNPSLSDVINLTKDQVDSVNKSVMKNSDDCIFSNINSEQLLSDYLSVLKDRKEAVTVRKHKFAPYVFMQSRSHFDKEIF